MKINANSQEFLKAISVEQMRNADAYTIAHFVPGRELMYRAARGVYESVSWENKKIAILAGSGNNGGDGYALAGILADHGIVPEIFQTSGKRSADGAYYYEKCQEKGLKPRLFADDTDLTPYDIIVDCILGTGFQGTPRGTAAAAIQRINETSAYVVSVDINSGLNGDTGEAVLAVRSDLTVSIGYYKKGLFLGKAQKYIGDLVNVDIGIVLPAMNPEKLITNIMDQIKEAQIKLGYARETVRLYYPAASLSRLLDVEMKDAEELLELLQGSPEFQNTALGAIEFDRHGDRIEVRIPPEGAEYVHRQVEEPEFLSAIITLFGTHHHCGISDIREVFARFSPEYVCQKMPEGTDFDYALYFPKGDVDAYYYCVKEEMEHTIYHRFTKEDFQALLL